MSARATPSAARSAAGLKRTNPQQKKPPAAPAAEAVEKVRQPPEGHQTHHPRDARGMLFGFPQYPFPAKKQPILRTAHTKSAVFFCQGVGIPGTCPGIPTLFSLPNFQQEVYRQAEDRFAVLFLFFTPRRGAGSCACRRAGRRACTARRRPAPRWGRPTRRC